MDSVVMAVAVETGQHVAQGEPILILEAMKMEVPLAAPYDCRVEALRVATGETVRSGMTLAVLRREEL